MSSLEPLRDCNFRRDPCSLEHIAAVVAAAVLCRQAAMMNPANPPKKVQEIIVLPSDIEQKIDRFMPFVKEQITWWNNFYDREIFYDRLCRRAHEYFHVLVWSTDGTINEEETAREMLKQDDLNAEEKYRIACNHCLENEIKTLRSNLKRKINLRNAERRYPLVYYWERVCRNDQTTGLTKVITEKLCNDDSSYPICAIDYFLNRLTFEKRISLVQESYFQKLTFRSWENLLMKLSNQELVALFDVCYRFYYLIRFWMHADFVVQIWMRIRDWYDYGAFVGMLGEFLTGQLFQLQWTDHHISLAVEIFNLAPYEWRNPAFFMYIECAWWNRDLNLTDVRLDVAILSNIDPDYKRYKFWPTKWFDLFKKYPTDCFLQFMDVCCGEEGSKEFKMEVMEICFTMLKEMRFTELDRLLSVFSSDPGGIMKTKQMILRDNFLKWRYWFGNDGLIFPPPSQLVDFIEGSFESIRSANAFKIIVLSSVNCLKACYKAAGSDMFDWLKDAVWMCSCNDDDFKRYKSMFLQLDVELAKSSGIPDVFNDPDWMSFLEWCSDEC
ncbi:uncharacterized protein LOC135845894 isoform X5 [Planococcus citri]|uniref:uncharacterized protein LOC135845894 isoform X5 n=1 Tax=Planococcus citri TaxID=170843 RepID=UPI0031F9A8F8